MNREQIVLDRRSGLSLTQVAKKQGISRASVCRLMKEANQNSDLAALVSDVSIRQEPEEPSMFDDIQSVLFASTDNVGKAFRVLNENLRLCLICEEVFTRQGAAEHADGACHPK